MKTLNGSKDDVVRMSGSSTDGQSNNNYSCKRRTTMSLYSSSFSSFCCWMAMFVWLSCGLMLASAETDFYEVLGVSRSATPKEIKKAYRQKSLEYHPDKNKAEGASEKFAEIARAYEVLTDEEKKSIYDQHGEEGLKQREQGGGGHHGGGFDDIFSQFFGGSRRRNDQEQRTPSIELPLKLTLKQLYLGDRIDVEYVRQVNCMNWEMCVKAAQDCDGPGVRIRRQQLAPGFVQQVQQRDERCIARGKMWNPNCSACPKKSETEKIDLVIDIQPGQRNGARITFDEVTDQKPGMKAGDLHFLIIEEPDPTFHRDRDNLYKTIEVPLVDALTGFKITLTHLDGHEFQVQVTTVTDCDHVMRVPGKGMPRMSGRGFGDLFITFEVDFPDELTEQQKKAIRAILGDGGSGREEL